MDFSHAIMTYERDDLLRDVIDSLLQVTTPETIVVYDSGSRPMVEAYSKKIGIRYVSSNAQSAEENFKLALSKFT